jgi:5-methylcytosine-specific restriction endonuclease McrBC regulatory subunit McrC
VALRRFQVAPNGNTIGLYLASDGARSLAIVVYPKFWQPRPAFRRVTWNDSDSHLAIAAGELDTIEIDGGADRLGLLDKPVNRSGASKESLVVPFASGAVTDEASGHDVSIAPLTALLGIESLMRRTQIGSVVPIDAGFVAPHLRDPLLRPILYRHFIDEVAEVIRHARREYSWTEEMLPIVTGRPDPSSLLVHSATGWPQVRCRFQEFSRSTPTLMAVCTALDHIANDGVVAGDAFGLGGDLRDDAIRLRRLLADVPTISRPLATRAAIDAQRAGRSGPWHRALELAVGVLWPDAGLNLGEDERAVEIAVDSSRVWELVLLEILRSGGLSAFDGNSAQGMPFNVERPWSGLGTQPPRPDLLVGDGANWIVLDAKYKDLTGTPAIDDLYQMFAYSHLGALQREGQIARSGLVYPARAGTAVGLPDVYLRAPDRSTSLTIHRVRYPSIDECRWRWRDYVDSQGPAFAAVALPPSFEALSA